MRRWSLALLISLASPALAQAPAAPTTPPGPGTEAPAAEAPAPAAAAPAPAPAAQEPAAPAPAPAAPAPAPKAPAARAPAAVPAAPTPAPSQGSQPAAPKPAAELSDAELARRDIQNDARYLFQSLLTGDVRSAANELFYPFQLEDKRYATPEELVAAWVKQLRLKRTDLITLYDVEVLPLEELEKKYGKAPARLGLDLRGQKDIWAAVGNLSGRPGIFLFRPYGQEYRAFAYTD